MVTLNQIPTTAPKNRSKKKNKADTKILTSKIKDLQITLSAEAKRSVLVIFQGMDASGKDGSSRAVFSKCSSLGVHGFSFKKPTEIEMQHDFLWRAHKITPSLGKIHIFNRSYYEDILIQRVHNWIDEDRVQLRMDAINIFEKLLIQDANTHIIKFYMHISPEVQQIKLQSRIDLKEDNYKHNEGDWKEAKLWNNYRDCYEYAINESIVPWHIVPCDSKSYRNYFVAKTIVQELESLKMTRPTL